MPSLRPLCLALIIAAWMTPAGSAPPHRLALLIGSPWRGEETVIQNDIASFRVALTKRGFKPSQLKELSGKLTRPQVLSAVSAVSTTTAAWGSGEVFLYYTGHGSFSGETVQTARPALALGPDSDPNSLVYWDEVFSAMRLPRGVQLILLPDC
jgi:hypothetical protein